MATAELVTPDQVIAPDGSTADVEWDAPCPACGSVWSSGPEKDRWGRWHCWKCGYKPGQGAVVPGGPEQPDWARLVQEAVTQAMRSEPQAMAEAMTAALGREGLADLARQQQEELGMKPASGGVNPGGS